MFNEYETPTEVHSIQPVLRSYILGMENKISIEPIPLFFVGKGFFDVVYNIYFRSIQDIFTKIRTDSIEENRPILLIGVIHINAPLGEDPIEIMPSGNIIKANMLGIFLSYRKNNYLKKFLDYFNNIRLNNTNKKNDDKRKRMVTILSDGRRKSSLFEVQKIDLSLGKNPGSLGNTCNLGIDGNIKNSTNLADGIFPGEINKDFIRQQTNEHMRKKFDRNTKLKLTKKSIIINDNDTLHKLQKLKSKQNLFHIQEGSIMNKLSHEAIKIKNFKTKNEEFDLEYDHIHCCDRKQTEIIKYDRNSMYSIYNNLLPENEYKMRYFNNEEIESNNN